MSITVDGTEVPLRAVGAGPDGLPSTAGVQVSRGRTVVRLPSAAPLSGVGPGATLTLTRADGTVARRTVAELRTVANAAAARTVAGLPAGGLAVVAPAGGGNWLYLRAR